MYLVQLHTVCAFYILQRIFRDGRVQTVLCLFSFRESGWSFLLEKDEDTDNSPNKASLGRGAYLVFIELAL